MSVRFLDIAAQLRGLMPEFAAALAEVVESGQIVDGPAVSRFEAEFAQFCDAPIGVGVSSGTAALRLALIACGIRAGDEVIVPTLTFIATASAVVHAGGRPVFVDCDPETLLIDVEQVGRAIGPRTRAVIPVHLYGLPAHMDPLAELAAQHGLSLIEDASQAHGATYRGRPVGSLAPIACFSLYPTKNLGALGDAGVITTRLPEVAQAIRLWRNHCRDPRSEHLGFGYNERLDTIQAAFLLVRLRTVAEHVRQRQGIAARYRAMLARAPLRWQAVPPGRTHAYHLCVVQAPDRDDLQRYLKERGVDTSIHYRNPLHLLPPGLALGYRPGQLPVAEAAVRAILSLPCYAGMPPEHVEAVARQIARFYGVPLQEAPEGSDCHAAGTA